MKNHQVPNSQIENVRKSLFIFGFSRPFSRYADSRLGKFIREELKPLVEDNDDSFPYKWGAVYWVKKWEKIDNLEDLVQQNHNLALHLVQRRTGAKVKYEKNAPQIDHIFPRSRLRELDKFDESEINHFTNFWILGKNKNQNKSKQTSKGLFCRCACFGT